MERTPGSVYARPPVRPTSAMVATYTPGSRPPTRYSVGRACSGNATASTRSAGTSAAHERGQEQQDQRHERARAREREAAQLGQQQGQPGGGAHAHGQGEEEGLVPLHAVALARREQGQEQEAGPEEEDQP